jgi:hypothetical protein
MKQVYLIIALAFIVFKANCQQTPYNLPLPEKWGVEKIAFPISFAPGVPFKGSEEIRFAPGWGDSKQENYWSYGFLWFIDGTPKINEDVLKQYLTQYYNGLYLSNQKGKPATLKEFTQLQVKKIATAADDKETYEGRITTLNFLSDDQIILNARIHVRNYAAANKSAILFEISPKDYKQPIWAQLDGIVSGFQFKQ